MKNLVPYKKSQVGEWNPFAEFDRFRREMTSLFDDSFGSWPARIVNHKDVVWMPTVDVHETETQVVLRADLPGMEKKDIQITLHGDVLKLSGEKKHESQVKEKDYFHQERYYGSFEREIELPCEVDASKSQSEYQNGVLRLTLKKKEGARPKPTRIEIK